MPLLLWWANVTCVFYNILYRQNIFCRTYWNYLLCVSSPGVSFNSVYTQIWRVLLHLAADPFPEVSDLAMKVLNSIAYKVCCVSSVLKLPYTNAHTDITVFKFFSTLVLISHCFFFLSVSICQFVITWLCCEKDQFPAHTSHPPTAIFHQQKAITFVQMQLRANDSPRLGSAKQSKVAAVT